MTRGVENTLLAHGGTEDIDIPTPTVRAILTDAICSGELARENELLRSKITALTNERDELVDRNQHLADERDFYKNLANQHEERAMGKVYD